MTALQFMHDWARDCSRAQLAFLAAPEALGVAVAVAWGEAGERGGWRYAGAADMVILYFLLQWALLGSGRVQRWLRGR